eukprot:scaffold184129_cov27-Tisochrysis_lutea.AAC.2
MPAQVEGSGCLFRTAQMVAGHLRRYLMATSTDITFMEPGLATLFSRVTASNERVEVLVWATLARSRQSKVGLRQTLPDTRPSGEHHLTPKQTLSYPQANTVLYEAPSYVVLPPLTVRQARVEDHDEMLPVLERASI